MAKIKAKNQPLWWYWGDTQLYQAEKGRTILGVCPSCRDVRGLRTFNKNAAETECHSCGQLILIDSPFN